MAAPSQIALPLAPGADGQAHRIIVGSANRKAVDALADPLAWPYRTAILTGPPRSGKSLLARWFELAGKGAIIDGADTIDETELFHRWNRAQEEGEALLLVAKDEAWDIALPDLRSRLGAALHIGIGQPDDAMLAELIELHAARHGLALGEGALTYLVPRVTRSFAEIERVVAAIDRLSLERKAPPTMGIWRDALEAVQGPEQARLL
ncbi:ATPase [Altererythrobacter sp. MTPC7]|uniref:ATPase n=1 Tax=Altererythrobacter sp. MTPC7 TaxID=3056567 RepID=UPI0036F28419